MTLTLTTNRGTGSIKGCKFKEFSHIPLCSPAQSKLESTTPIGPESSTQADPGPQPHKPVTVQNVSGHLDTWTCNPKPVRNLLVTLVKSFIFPGLVAAMQEELRGQVSSLETAHHLVLLPWVTSGEEQTQRLQPRIASRY